MFSSGVTEDDPSALFSDGLLKSCSELFFVVVVIVLVTVAVIKRIKYSKAILARNASY